MARQVRMRAYAPYSGYLVGAVVVDEEGRAYAGVNVENVSFGSTICAERAAILRMVAEGGKSVATVVVSTVDGGAPCGACLQVIAEFAEAATPILLAPDEGSVKQLSLSTLLPHRFTSSTVERTFTPQ